MDIPPFRHKFAPQLLAGSLSKKRVAGSVRKMTEGVEKPKRNKSQPLARSHDSNAKYGFLDFLKRQKQPEAVVKSQKKSQKRKMSSTVPPALKSRQPQLTAAKRLKTNTSQPLARKQQRPQEKQGKTKCKQFSGAVSEDQHALECPAGPKKFCIRCDFRRRKTVYESWSLQAGRPWLASGVVRGVWGLGCVVCAQLRSKHSASGERHRLHSARCSKFATFGNRPASAGRAKWLIDQHERSESHRVASGFKERGAKAKPFDTVPDVIDTVPDVSPSADADAELLKGNVPSAADWKDAWAALTDRVSLRCESRVFCKKMSLGTSAITKRRKRHRRQLLVMAEVLRRRIRTVLSKATFISLAMDESKYRKIIRFRADLPCLKSSSLWRSAGASGFSVSGVLGILDCSKKHASDFEDDHALTAVKQLDAFLTKFCTPLGRGRRDPQPLACDLDLKAHLLKTVTTIAADGASKERRALFLAVREMFPNLLIVIRDPAHAIRIASKALHCDDEFGKVWHDLFDSRHALVPDLMHSAKWHNLLVAIQEDNLRVVALPGAVPQSLTRGAPPPPPLARAVKNVAFAKQRFDSTAEPVAKIALMILPVATLLAYIASDRRHESDQRERATTLLKQLNTKFCTATGVSADWGIICKWFLRLFDKAYHDIAKSRREIDGMIETLDAVFLEGRVFQAVLSGAASGANKEPSADSGDVLPPLRTDMNEHVGFITTKVVRHLRHKYVFYAGGMPVLLWGEPTQPLADELINRLQNVACLTKERLLADFPRDDIRSALCIFDRRLVLRGFGPLPDQRVRKQVLRAVRQLATLMGCEEAAAVLQYNSVIPYMLNQLQAGDSFTQPLAGDPNQPAWALLLRDDVWNEACPKRSVSASRALRRMIRFYISIEDGECTVERDLGELRSQLASHCTGSMEFHDDSLMLKLNGPKTSADFDEGAANTRQELSPFSRECASLWREIVGTRFGHFNLHATLAAKLKRQTTAHQRFSGVVRNVLVASRLAVSAKRRLGDRQGARSEQPLALLHPGAGTSESSLWNGSMGKFQARSRRNIPGVTQTRAGPGCPFVPPVGVNLRENAAGVEPQSLTRQYRKIASFGLPRLVVASRSAEVVVGRNRCAEADLVIVRDLELLHDVSSLAADEDLTVSFLYIVSFGVAVITAAQFEAAQCNPKRISPEQIAHHSPALRQPLAVVVGDSLATEHPDVRRAFRRVAKADGSKVTLLSSRDSAPASGGCHFQTLQDVVTWAGSVRAVKQVRGRHKAITVDGVPVT